MTRDQRNSRLLEQERWEVFTIRECTLEQDTTQLIWRLEELRSAPELAP